MLSERERVDRLRLIRTENVGPITFRNLIQRYGAATAAIEALPDLARRGGRARPLKVSRRDDALREIDDHEQFGANLLILGDEKYPPLLAATEDGPPVFSAMGHLHLLKTRIIGVVGARNASGNARTFTRAIAEGLGENGFTVASGLARGIDAAAHEGSLASGTVAVVAGGLNMVYPPEHAELQERIAQEGLVVAEPRLGVKPQARHFPSRNRIIAGLSVGVVVVEATRNSGSLITARCALNQGREVFAVPGSPLDPRCAGTNQLLREGANLIESAADIIAALTAREIEEPVPDISMFTDSNSRPPPAPVEVTADQRQSVLELLGPSALPVDELIRQCHLSSSIVITILLEAELSGQVERHPGNCVSLCIS